MQANLETLSSLERRLSVTLPTDKVNTEIENRLKRLARTVKLHGFRPGKVPMKIVEQQFGGQVRQEVLGDAVQQSFGEAVKEKNLRVAGYPRIEVKPGATPADPFEYIATFEVYPEFSVGELGQARIERPVVVIGDAEVDRTVDILRKQRTHYHAVERAAQSGDQVLLDYRGTMGGEAFEGGTGADQSVLLGGGQLLADFEKNVVGMKAGESKAFDMRFPDDYHGKEVAGKDARFEVTVKQVQEPHVPEADEAFAKSLGIADGDLDKMRADVKANLEREVKRRADARVKDQVMKSLLDATRVEVPRALVEMEIERLMHNMRHDLESRGLKADKVPMPREAFEPEAVRRVTLGLILAETVRLNGLEARPEQIKAVVQQYAQSYEKPEEVVRWYYQQPERLGEVESIVLEDNVVQWALSKAGVEDRTVAFEELMGNPQ
ncbi:MAG TPA: trigger factor [Burkholderiales bacterium]|nr:trigger factor [Burkholderiales bacterium]